MKILVSGGHLTPALAFIEYAKQFPENQIVFVGRVFAQAETKQTSHEEDEVKAIGVRFVALESGKMPTYLSKNFFAETSKILSGISRAFAIIRQEKPDVFVSFGGYLAVPLAIASYFQHIPIVTHEQTHTAGMANKLIAMFAQKVAVSYPETAQYFPAKKTIVTGNPLRKTVLATVQAVRPAFLQKFPNKPILYVTGGSQGSLFINDLIARSLLELTEHWFVIHQCGNSTEVTNYLQELTNAKDHLPPDQQQDYTVTEWLTEQDQAWIYTHTMGVVARAGANTVQELMRLGKPAIFIPLMHARDNEQLKNAQMMASAGAAIILEQPETTPEKFLETMENFYQRYDLLRENAQKLQSKVILDADQKLYEIVATL